ncbi:hypothetical protein [Lachnoclostridium phytofermentans]|uniref:anti-sigma-I factor RsgI family protein n=1 Tax=Lachnoclostridium phytofermentans TaxID=66219 RepID=UPI000496D167|nr:hypothetical protein [Lachnoclostridium phytofermentans]
MKQQVITSLQQAIESLPHPLVEQLATSPVIKLTEHDFITRQELTKKKSFFSFRKIAIAFCCLCIIFAATINLLHTGSQTPYSFLTLDVNPGFEILLNHKNDIISIQGINEEAKVLLKDSSYKSSSIQDTLNDLILRLVEANYITIEHNTILLTIQCKDESYLDELEKNLTNTIQSTLHQENISPNLVIQKKKENAPTSLPSKDITSGKQYFINSILSKYPELSGEKLESLSLDELLTLLASGSLPALSDKVILPSEEDDKDDILDSTDEKEDEEEFEDNDEEDSSDDDDREDNTKDTDNDSEDDSFDDDDFDNEDTTENDADTSTFDEEDEDSEDKKKEDTRETEVEEDEDINTNVNDDVEDSIEDTSIQNDNGIQDEEESKNYYDEDSSTDSEHNSDIDSDSNDTN